MVRSALGCGPSHPTNLAAAMEREADTGISNIRHRPSKFRHGWPYLLLNNLPAILAPESSLSLIAVTDPTKSARLLC